MSTTLTTILRECNTDRNFVNSLVNQVADLTERDGLSARCQATALAAVVPLAALAEAIELTGKLVVCTPVAVIHLGKSLLGLDIEGEQVSLLAQAWRVVKVLALLSVAACGLITIPLAFVAPHLIVKECNFLGLFSKPASLPVQIADITETVLFPPASTKEETTAPASLSGRISDALDKHSWSIAGLLATVGALVVGTYLYVRENAPNPKRDDIPPKEQKDVLNTPLDTFKCNQELPNGGYYNGTCTNIIDSDGKKIELRHGEGVISDKYNRPVYSGFFHLGKKSDANGLFYSYEQGIAFRGQADGGIVHGDVGLLYSIRQDNTLKRIDNACRLDRATFSNQTGLAWVTNAAACRDPHRFFDEKYVITPKARSKRTELNSIKDNSQTIPTINNGQTIPTIDNGQTISTTDNSQTTPKTT